MVEWGVSIRLSLERRGDLLLLAVVDCNRTTATRSPATAWWFECSSINTTAIQRVEEDWLWGGLPSRWTIDIARLRDPGFLFRIVGDAEGLRLQNLEGCPKFATDKFLLLGRQSLPSRQTRRLWNLMVPISEVTLLCDDTSSAASDVALLEERLKLRPGQLRHLVNWWEVS